MPGRREGLCFFIAIGTRGKKDKKLCKIGYLGIISNRFIIRIGRVLFNLFGLFREFLSKRMIFYTPVMTKIIPNGNLLG